MKNCSAVLELVRKDHDRIRHLLKQSMQTNASEKDRREKFRELRREVTLHGLIEEELIYPKLARLQEAKHMLQVAQVQHATADRLINNLEILQPKNPLWDKLLKQLWETMNIHMRHEEAELKRFLPLACSHTDLNFIQNKARAYRAA